MPVSTAGAASFATPTSVYADTLFTHGDGSVTAASCGSHPYHSYDTFRITSLTPTGDVTNNPTGNAYYPAWYTQAATGIDGTLYMMDSKREPSGYLHPYLAAYKNNVKLWARDFDVCPSNSIWGYPRSVSVGADGDVYAVIARSGCSSGTDSLVGLDSDTGNTKFQVDLATSFFNTWYQQPLHAYTSGLVIVDGNRLRYLTYQGVETTASCNLTGSPDPCPLQIASDEQRGEIVHDSQGRIFISALKTLSGTCSGSKIAKVYRLDPDGTGVTLNVQDKCMTGVIKPTPSGGLAVLEVLGSWGSLNRARFVLLNSAGATVTDQLLHVGMTGYLVKDVSPMEVDGNGNVIIVRTATQTSGERDQNVFVERIDSSGVRQTIYSTEQFNTTGTSDLFDRASLPALSEHKLYLSICDAECKWYSALPTIHAVSDASLAMDYPRSAVFDTIETAQGEQLVYVAGGDSFSSGQGVPGPNGFIPPTNTNDCHRSGLAYPMLLDNIPSLNLNLQSFRACSGATTQTMRDGMNGERGQLDAITSDADLVTVTVGGNDIDYGNGMLACVQTADAQVCEDTLGVIRGNVHAPWFRERIETLFADIHTKAPEAEVLVMGYPLFMGEPGEPHCSWTILRSMTPTEVDLVDDIGITLNAIIAEEAGQAGFVFIPVDETFADHTVCSSEPFINGVDLAHNEYSYHPNATGQEAYAQLIEDHLS